MDRMDIIVALGLIAWDQKRFAKKDIIDVYFARLAPSCIYLMNSSMRLYIVVMDLSYHDQISVKASDIRRFLLFQCQLPQPCLCIWLIHIIPLLRINIVLREDDHVG